MTEPSYKTGDVFLLFTELPYDFDGDELPLKLLENLYFDRTPSELLTPKRSSLSNNERDLLEYAGLVNMVLPGHTLPGVGLVHCCLRYDNGNINQYPDFEPQALFSTFITALRLQKPCRIAVGGIFRFGGDDEPIQGPTLWHITSPYNRILLSYSQKDIQIATNITKELLEIRRSSDESRIKSAFSYFSQVTQGFSYSLQLSYLGLWASLEAMFQPTSNKAKTLAKRITVYLSTFGFKQDMAKWLENEYTHRRSRFIHGSHIAPPNLQNIKSPDAFSKLHEITRLCFLGFLSLEKSKLTQILQQKGKQLQRTLDNLGQAQGRFLDQQKMYLK
ncbi:MAG: hypothetical protein ABSF37_04430 [Sedimentisphaerales bacterium]|jgi:hypothetical protein